MGLSWSEFHIAIMNISRIQAAERGEDPNRDPLRSLSAEDLAKKIQSGELSDEDKQRLLLGKFKNPNLTPEQKRLAERQLRDKIGL